MYVPTIDQPFSRLTANIIDFLLHATGYQRGAKIGQGLPAGAILVRDINLIIGATPCDAPMFHEQMQRAAEATGADVVLAHHGLHPESLNEVSFSAFVQGKQQPQLLERMLLFRATDRGYWLINSAPGQYIALDPMGLVPIRKPPFSDRDQRSDGICRAAADIVRAARLQEIS